MNSEIVDKISARPKIWNKSFIGNIISHIVTALPNRSGHFIGQIYSIEVKLMHDLKWNMLVHQADGRIGRMGPVSSGCKSWK